MRNPSRTPGTARFVRGMSVKHARLTAYAQLQVAACGSSYVCLLLGIEHACSLHWRRPKTSATV